MMKWIAIVFSYLLTSRAAENWNFSHMAMNFYEEALHRSRRPLAFLLMGIASIIFICGGILMSLFDATTQYDLTGQIYPGAVISGGLLLATLFIAALIYGFQKLWPAPLLTEKTHQKHQHENQTPDLKDAMSLLILDYIEERKNKRTQEQTQYEDFKKHQDYGRSSTTPPPF